MDWFILAIIAVFTGSASFLLQRVLMKDDKSDAFTYAIVFQILCAIFLGVFSSFNGFSFPNIMDLKFNYLLVGVLYAGGALASFQAYKTLEASQVSIIAATSPLWTIIGALFFLQESFTSLQFIGSLLVLLAIILVNYTKRGIAFNQGTIYALLFAIFFGIALVNDKYILNVSPADALSYTTIAFALPALIMIIIRPFVFKKMKVFLQPKILKNMLIMSFLYSVSAAAFFIALDSGANASQLGAINKSSVIVTIILAALFLKERGHLVKKIIAALLVTIGVILLR